MYTRGWFWLPCLVSLFVFRKLIKERRIPSAPALTAGNDTSSSASSGSASASASASASGGEYEVFLSFCGKDTRHTFTDFLYNDLVDAGIRTFRDDNELRVGEEIGPELLKAIKESKISIPVFSENYASSKWCLREFAQMIECRTTLGQKIFPIFYKVEPSEVKHQTGSFEQAFLNHKERVDGTIVQGWKEALTKVGELKGWVLNKENNGRYEGELVKKVTLNVWTELKKKNHMYVTHENLVGIEDQVKEMEELLNAYSDAVQIVGILGMGGIGKTTLAKVIYSQIFEHFQGCCFLSDVRVTSQQSKGLVDLQNELCRKILKKESLGHITNVDEGRNMIKDIVCRKKVLIVLDDVDEKSQIDNLVGERKWFARGSKIIVTTRDEDVQKWIVVDRTYKPLPMERDHSLQLFSKHAFQKDFPPEEYVTLSTKFVHIAAGLPLALEIIGSSLYREDKSYWEDMLEKLEKIPHQDVLNKLKVSYDTLKDEEKQIFLDIACFFIKEDARIPSYMWDACKFYPKIGINVLIRRSLIKIRDDNKLWMHDQLRDLGRDIVRCENSNEPWKRSRVWSCEDALETLETCKETQEHEAVKVEAFKVQAGSVKSDLPFPKEFGQLKRLRYLEVEYKEYTKYISDRRVGDFKHYFPKLRWLKWHGLLSHYRVTNFHLEKLIILDLSWSSFIDKSDCWNQIKMAKNLKVLNLTFCFGFGQAPDFSTFAALEMLILKYCWDLVKIDPSIGNLTSLRVLDISYCKSITELPDAIGNLEKLEEIHAFGCQKLVRLDPWIRNLTSLRVLDISYCWSITELPDAIGYLEKLEEIKASNCDKLKGEFPDIRRLSSLRILNLFGSRIDSLPESICELTTLKTLDLYKGPLEWLPELPSSLTSLVVPCRSMKACLSITKLESSEFFNCYRLVEIPTYIRDFSELAILILHDTSISTLPAVIGDFPRLKILSIRSRELQSIQGLPSSLINLSISSSRSMERLPDLSNLKNLSTLLVRRCSKLMHIKCIGKIESLTRLTVIKCKKLAEVDGIENYESLRYLTTRGCKSLYRLSDLSNLGMLEDLDLSGCRKLAKVEGLSFLKSLELLNMSFCTSLEGIPNVSNLGMLKNLDLSHCRKLAKVEVLSFLKSLEELNMSFCTSLDILDLSNLGMLKNLYLSHCRKLAKVEGLSFLKSLEKLSMSLCTSLEGILDLSNLGMLKYLDLSRCRKLAKVEGLSFLKSLELLNMSFCTSLDILDLSNLGMLKYLYLSNCWKLAKVKGLSFLKSLELLDMSFCISLEGILDLSNLGMLNDLDLSHCRKLAKVEGLSFLKSLERLNMSFCCTSLEGILDLSNLKKLRWLDISGSSKSIENPLDLLDTRIVKDSSCWFRSEAFKNEKEDASHGGSDGSDVYGILDGSDGSDDSDSGEYSDCEYE